MIHRSSAEYVADITTALQASDAQGLARIALELLVVAGKEFERREKDRARKHRSPRNSTESTEIHGIPEMRSSSSSLNTHLTEKDYSASAEIRGIHGTEIDEAIQRLLDLLRGAMGDVLFPAADEFIRRRPYRTWKGWLDEMLTLLGPGSQYNPADMARVCKDDAALDRPIGSPRGLRSFLLNARNERLSPKRENEGSDGKASAGLVVNQIRGLIKANPGRGSYLPKADVAALGADVLRAYESVGGAERFVNLSPKDLPFLIRDFGNALNQKGAA